MKIFLTFIFVILVQFPVFSKEKKTNCVTGLQKLNPECNLIGKTFEKLKKFSNDNKTIDQTYKNIKNKNK